MSSLVAHHSKKLMSVAVLLCIAGIGVLAPSIPDGILGIVNSILKTNVQLDVPPYVGWIMLIGGTVLGIFLLVRLDREGDYVAGKKFIAITHASFATPLSQLGPELSLRKQDEVINRVCDMSACFNNKLDIATAMHLQNALIADVRADQKTPRRELAYAGIVHIPLQFHLGNAIATGEFPRLFEKERASGRWKELEEQGKDLQVRTEWLEVSSPAAAIVRIEISYAIEDEAVYAVAPSNAIEVRIGIAEPKIDAVHTYSQVREIVTRFREAMDRVKDTLPAGAEVHVFYAGPVSVGFSLGRAVSSTIHNATYVYNYDRQSMPAYRWCVLVNSTRNEFRIEGISNV